MTAGKSPPRSRTGALLRSPLAWVAAALVLAMMVGAALVGMELFASTSLPMILNPR